MRFSKPLFSVLGLFLFLQFTAQSQITKVVTKTYNPGSPITVDGCGTYCSILPGVTFTTADFPSQCEIFRVQVRINWRKTDGTCSVPVTGNAYHAETSFRLDGPSGNEIIAPPGTWYGGVTISNVTTTFRQNFGPSPSGTPVSGNFKPVSGNFNNFNGNSPIGTWYLRAGDNAGADPLCVYWYEVKIWARDPAPPVVTCPSNQPIYLSNSCTAVMPDFTGLVTATDDCTANPIITQMPAPGMTLPGGAGTVYPITITAQDLAGRTSTCTFNATVTDNTPPTAICQNATVYLNSAGSASIQPSDIDNGSYDNCSVSGLSLNQSAFDCGDKYILNPVTLTVTDASGNTSTCTANVQVHDTISPTAVCQNVSVNLDASGSAIVMPSALDNGSSDNCGISLMLYGDSLFDCSDIGINPVTLTLYDTSGNTSTCSATITVNDNMAPNTICQNATVYLDASGNASITAADINNGSTDNCGIASMALSTSSFSCADIGANSVTLTVTDVNGNVGTCTATVTVVDNIAPTVACQTSTAYLDANGIAAVFVADVNNGSTDNCGIALMTVSQHLFSCSEIGVNPITLYVTDTSGNTDSCSTTVNILDTLPPTVVCQNITVNLDASGSASITASDIDNGSTDNCAIASMAINNNSFTCANVGNNTVILTVTDVNGNSNTCTATVTVVDNMAPVAVCQNATVYLDASGNASVSTSDINNGSSDNCAIASMSLNNTSFTCADLGLNSVTLTVTDVNGNTSTCTSTVTVIDNIAPTAVCQNITVGLDASGIATILPAAVNNGSADNCGIASMSLNNSTFTCSDIGNNTVILTVTDSSGNSSSCNATVTVIDNMAPIAQCQFYTVHLDNTGNGAITTADIDNGSTDNCGIASISLSNSTFNCADVGMNTVVLTVTDVNGNSSTCNATVMVVDTVSPTAICQTAIAYLDQNGSVTIDSSDVDNGSTDVCGISTIALSQYTFSCADTGMNNITMTVTDVYGNTSTCQSNVFVLDTLAPVVVCQSSTAYLDANGIAAVFINDINNGSTDNCGISLMTVSQHLFYCSDVGQNTITLYATDASGNTDSCTTTVNIVDTIAPTAICQNIDVYLDANGTAGISVSDIDNGSFDNCSIDTIMLGTSIFDCSNLGVNTVSLTVVDAAGLSSTCTSTVTVYDSIAPLVVCRDTTLYLNVNGELNITASMMNNGSTDNCIIDSLWIDTSFFDCSGIGSHFIILSGEDASGNTSSCIAILTVADSLAPLVSCKDTTLYLDASGMAYLSASEMDNGSTDNCAIDSMYLNKNVFSCTEPEFQQVDLTITDISGNQGSCASNVSIIDTFHVVNLGPDTMLCYNWAPYTLDAGTGWASYLWSDGSTGQTLDIDPTKLSQGFVAVSVTVTSDNGCTATDTIEFDISPCLAVTEIGGGNISLYPNPASSHINIEMQNFSYSGAVRVRIRTITGSIANTQQMQMSNGQYEGRIDVNHLAPGIYFIEVSWDGYSSMHRFVIK